MTREPNDWRLQNQRAYLTGVTLQWRTYRAFRPDWEHDHCEFCWAKFAESEGEEFVRAGFATADEKKWVCRVCFEDFQPEFGWHVLTPAVPPN